MFYQSFFKNVILSGLDSLRQKRVSKLSLIFYDSTNIFFKHQNKVFGICHYIIQGKDLVDSKELISDFPCLKNLNGLDDLKSPFSLKNFLVLMISFQLAPKLPILVPFGGLDHQKSKFILILGNLSVRHPAHLH